MFGPRLSHVFRSRWHALMWSASILATAYCSIPAPDADDGMGAVSNSDQAAEAGEAQQIVNAWSDVGRSK